MGTHIYNPLFMCDVNRIASRCAFRTSFALWDIGTAGLVSSFVASIPMKCAFLWEKYAKVTSAQYKNISNKSLALILFCFVSFRTLYEVYNGLSFYLFPMFTRRYIYGLFQSLSKLTVLVWDIPCGYSNHVCALQHRFVDERLSNLRGSQLSSKILAGHWRRVSFMFKD